MASAVPGYLPPPPAAAYIKPPPPLRTVVPRAPASGRVVTPPPFMTAAPLSELPAPGQPVWRLPALAEKYFTLVLPIIGLLALLAFAPATPSHLKVYLIGDSTMSVKQVKAYPETGWGMPFAAFFNETVGVDNRAQTGRSTKSFMAEGRLDAIARTLKPGDTLLIQFGHNDANQAKPERYTPVPDYEANLKHFIAVARMAHAQPVLITPVTRRAFADGHVVPSFPTYTAAARRVAAETKVPLIDLAALSERWIDALGPDGSKRYYLHYAKGEGLPGYKDAVDDDTHFSELGARRIADLVAGGLARTGLPIAAHVRPDRPALLRETPAGGPSCSL